MHVKKPKKIAGWKFWAQGFVLCLCSGAANIASAAEAASGGGGNVSLWQLSKNYSSFLLGMALVLGGLAALWVIVLRRKVHEQTENLRESEKKFRVLVEQSLVGVYIIQNDRFAYVNPRFAEIFGYADDELVQVASVTDVVFGEDQQIVQENIRRRVNGESASMHYQFRGRRKDGAIIHVEVLGSRTEFQGQTAVVGTMLDITERKRAEAAVAETGGLLQVMLDNSPDCIYFKDRESRFVHYSKSFAKLFRLEDVNLLKGKSDFDLFTEEHARPAYEDEQRIIATGEPMIGKLEKETHPDGHVTWALTTKLPWHDSAGNIIGTFGISKDMTAIKEVEDRLSCEEELFRALLDNVPDRIFFKDLESRFVRVSRSKAEKTLEFMRAKHLREYRETAAQQWPAHLAGVDAFAEYLRGKTDFDTFTDEFARRAFEEEQAIIQSGKPIIGKLEELTDSDGKKSWFHVTKLPWCDSAGNVIGTFGVSRDITAIKEAETQLATAQQRLLETSRLAGMAEVATDVLHNVGNVLNSVNVSCSMTMDRTKNSKMASLARVSDLLNENKDHLDQFFTNDPRGKQIPEFMAALSAHLAEEQTTMRNDLEQLLKHIDHIKQIVSMQQSYAKVSGVKEQVSPLLLVEDALHINGAALARHDVRVAKEIEETPEILTERHKVLQILVNLIRNAKYALDEGGRKDKLMTIRVNLADSRFARIEVVDTGVGIKKENLTQIFSHGFTTRKNGHGFGLHSSALAAKELGGSLTAHSNGPGTGATFTLLLPLNMSVGTPQQSQSEITVTA
jgi:PAS domain S-box-containing protein